MKKQGIKGLFSALLVMILAFSMVGCGGSAQTGSTSGQAETGTEAVADLSKFKIGIVGYQETGEVPKAIKAFMDEIKKETGLKYEYVVGSSYDEQTNITTVQNLIASGCNGIIMTMDSGLEAIMQEAEMANVYVAGFLADMETSYEKIKDNKYFLGTICDGKYDNSSIGEKAAELVIADGIKNVGVVTFPFRYYPHKQEAIDKFTEVINEHNKTAAEKITIYETQELSFKALEPTYFSDYPEVEGIFSLAASQVYPTMVSANRTDVKLYTTGFNMDSSILEAINTRNINMMTFSNTEAILYPVTLLVNALTGERFEDQPASADRVDSSIVFISSPEELKQVQEKNFFYTTDFSKSFLNMEEIKGLMKVYNSEATYAHLVEVVDKMDMAAIAAK